MNPIAAGFLAIIGIMVFLNILSMVGPRSEAVEEVADHHHHDHDDHHDHGHDDHGHGHDDHGH